VTEVDDIATDDAAHPGGNGVARNLTRRSDSDLVPSVMILGVSLVVLAVAKLTSPSWLQVVMVSMAASLCTASLLMGILSVLRRAADRSVHQAIQAAFEHDESPCFLTDGQGTILARNRAARENGDSSSHLADALGRRVADAETLIHRLQSRARISGVASRDLVMRHGPIRVTASPVGPDSMLWRLDGAADRTPFESSVPMLRVSPTGSILSSNAAYRELAGQPPPRLDRLVLDPPLLHGHIHRIPSLSGPTERLVAESAPAGQSREVFLLPVGLAGSRPQGEAWDNVEDLPVPLLKLSSTGVVLASNRHARALLPVEIGARLSDLLDGLGRPVNEWVADVAEGRPTGGPQVVRGIGERQDTVLRVALNVAGAPDDLHLIAVLDDVTEFKALEAQFVQSQKMQALGQLAGGVAHDFNNLLTAISGHCDLLLLRHDERDPEYADLIQIRQNVNRAASLVGQLLAFSRKQSMMPETIDLRVALADLAHLLNRLVGEKVRLHLDHDPTLHHIRTDRRQLEQVIMNLVVNARDAMPDGGQILIETENRFLTEPLHCDRAVVPPGRYVLVRVIDEGTGIPPDRLPKIFEPFYTTKRLGEGTGLRLSTAYGIMKQSAATSSPKATGARPPPSRLLGSPRMTKAPAASAALEPPPPSPGPRKESVLLVEDEAPVPRLCRPSPQGCAAYTVLEPDRRRGPRSNVSPASARGSTSSSPT
jgi:two-component system cell cycle sensor histidine kinase/response regulator CckA